MLKVNSFSTVLLPQWSSESSYKYTGMLKSALRRNWVLDAAACLISISSLSDIFYIRVWKQIISFRRERALPIFIFIWRSLNPSPPNYSLISAWTYILKHEYEGDFPQTMQLETAVWVRLSWKFACSGDLLIHLFDQIKTEMKHFWPCLCSSLKCFLGNLLTRGMMEGQTQCDLLTTRGFYW